VFGTFLIHHRNVPERWTKGVKKVRMSVLGYKINITWNVPERWMWNVPARWMWNVPARWMWNVPERWIWNVLNTFSRNVMGTFPKFQKLKICFLG
jgi:hypothetical protein